MARGPADEHRVRRAAVRADLACVAAARVRRRDAVRAGGGPGDRDRARARGVRAAPCVPAAAKGAHRSGFSEELARIRRQAARIARGRPPGGGQRRDRRRDRAPERHAQRRARPAPPVARQALSVRTAVVRHARLAGMRQDERAPERRALVSGRGANAARGSRAAGSRRLGRLVVDQRCGADRHGRPLHASRHVGARGAAAARRARAARPARRRGRRRAPRERSAGRRAARRRDGRGGAVERRVRRRAAGAMAADRRPGRMAGLSADAAQASAARADQRRAARRRRRHAHERRRQCAPCRGSCAARAARRSARATGRALSRLSDRHEDGPVAGLRRILQRADHGGPRADVGVHAAVRQGDHRGRRRPRALRRRAARVGRAARRGA
ncbi:putative type VI secretion protein IcmF [Burkholderia pseudomallei MSHR640]|nr:putative type VI secretion protein IcmF [Burkholderia pseudomallei MSHR640]